MKHNRLLSLLLALILLAGAAVPARCAGQPTVICETGVKDGVVSLSLEDLDGSAVYGVQLELVLEGEYPRSVFTPSSRAAYSPGCVVETRRDTTSVTVYLTGSAALNRDGTVDLGELDLGMNELVSWDALRQRDPSESAAPAYDRVHVRQFSGDGNRSRRDLLCPVPLPA